jgi:cyclopropane-fatty-acyl-phospholipid synthase
MPELPAPLVAALAELASGAIEVEDEGRVVRFGAGRQVARVRWSAAASARLVRDGTIGVGDGWVAREWDMVEGSLLELLRLLARERVHQRVKAHTPMPRRVLDRVATLRDRATRFALHRSVRSHYDIGSDFFALWLDPSMTYTCGVAYEPSDDLATMQRNKLALVCHKLRLAEGDSLLDLGCGFGSLALHAAREHAARVVAVNVARDQLAWLRAQLASASFSDRVTVLESDWRDVRGSFDRVAAIGLAEHVGRAGLPKLMRKIRDCLVEAGVAVVQSIGSADDAGIDPWIERRIFPGADVPALSELVAAAERSDLRVCHVESLGEHYALTMSHWLRNFTANEAIVRERWGDALARTWQFYLASLIAAFESCSTTLYQLVLTPGSGPNASWPPAPTRLPAAR